jgi:hypothetical protein
MTALTTSVFDFVGDYAKELASRKDLPVDFDEEEDLLVFTREFFIQFFQDVFAYQIVTFDDTTAINAFVASTERTSVDSPVAKIVDSFREFVKTMRRS